MKENDDFLDIPTSAKFAHTSVSKLLKDCHFKRIPYYKMGKRNWIKKSDLLMYIEQKRIPTVEELQKQAEQNLISKQSKA